MALPLWRLTTWRRRLFELVGSRRYSRPSAGHIEQKLMRYFEGPGVFVEAGAVDGVFESNTYYLERFLGWRGVLVEPVSEMYARLPVNRPEARAFNCALVGSDFRDAVIPLVPAHAMSKVGSALPAGLAQSRLVPARTLASVVDEAGLGSIDLLSLDVEGFEVEVLKGLDFSRHRPRFILVECLTPALKEEMDRFLSPTYRFVEAFTYRDFLYASS